MVDRSGFYIDGDKLCRIDVKIDWNLGFDKLAKEAYVAELITALRKVCPGMDIAEVTSASTNEYTRMLSPIFIEYRGGTSMEVTIDSSIKTTWLCVWGLIRVLCFRIFIVQMRCTCCHSSGYLMYSQMYSTIRQSQEERRQKLVLFSNYWIRRII